LKRKKKGSGMTITKTVIPAAGLGTRFLPYTKVIPKEMLPIINKPAIQHSVEEALASGVSDFLLITGKGKTSIADHLDASYSHEVTLEERDKTDLLSCTDRLSRLGSYTYIRQPEPLGLGHAISLAHNFISPKEYFGIILPDDIIDSKDPALKQLMRIALQEKASIIAVQEVPPNCVSSYGIINIKKTITPNLFQLSGVVEKPKLKDAPSNLAIVGRYILSAKIFNSLECISTRGDSEIQLTDGINHMIQNNERVFAYKIQGRRYDLGTPIGWLKANIGYALKNPEYASQIKTILEEADTSNSILYNPAKAIEHIL
jgi:UTP--glucose-1-phosphate uridylyltransferase